jgi:hypothetical protein
MDISVDSLETPALTKAQLAELLFEQIGLNKRESKDMVDASRSPALVTSRFAPRRRVPAETHEPARRYRSTHAGWSPFTPAKNSKSRFKTMALCLRCRARFAD